jgi:hypothetical protein
MDFAAVICILFVPAVIDIDAGHNKHIVVDNVIVY